MERWVIEYRSCITHSNWPVLTEELKLQFQIGQSKVHLTHLVSKKKGLFGDIPQGQKLGFPSLETVLVTHSFPGVYHNLKPSSLLLLRTKSFPVRPQNRKTLRIELVNLDPAMETPCTELEYSWKTIWYYCKLHANSTI